MPQEVIELGFNEQELTAQQKRIVKLLTELYDMTLKLEAVGKNLSPINISGFTELNKAVIEQNKLLAQANKTSQEYAKQQIIAAKAAEANAKTTEATAKAQAAIIKSESEVIKQIELETKVQTESAKASKAKAEATKAEIQADSEVIKQLTVEQKLEQELLKTEKLRAQQTNAAAKAVADAGNKYKQLSATLKQQEIAYTNLALSEGRHSKAAKEALAEHRGQGISLTYLMPI